MIINALKVTGADLRVGIDTVFPTLDMVFVRKCEILKNFGDQLSEGDGGVYIFR